MSRYKNNVTVINIIWKWKRRINSNKFYYSLKERRKIIKILDEIKEEIENLKEHG